jgi:hypothetical protein
LTFCFAGELPGSESRQPAMVEESVLIVDGRHPVPTSSSRKDVRAE